jgi:spore germination cell wall hydrolase CwlJ-like protein
VILNRVADERFPDTISEVLCQQNQFSTVRNGHSIVGRTELSDQAVVEAVEWIESGDAPTDLLFFNCMSYNIGIPYDYIGGNYFMRLEVER